MPNEFSTDLSDYPSASVHPPAAAPTPMESGDSGPNRIDVHIGLRIRMRRRMLGMSQNRLGAEVGVTFQQIQKYERGSSRVGASRLFDLSEVLEVPVSYFFEGLEPTRRGAVPLPPIAPQQGEDRQGEDRQAAGATAENREALTLVSAYSRIGDPGLRRRVVKLVKSIAQSGGEKAVEIG